ncbi:hypothetical protein [Cohnella boryungensis]|uniref:Uncharacterized protein n=1 Tax=Cohnella boryungensis TaxID=768479 RepID=A0ABV8SHS8_9BACL
MQWRHQEARQRLQVKILFHQFVYEMLGQIKQQKIELNKPDLVGQAIRYSFIPAAGSESRPLGAYRDAPPPMYVNEGDFPLK